MLVTALLSAAIARFPRRRVAPWAFGLSAVITALTWFGYQAVAMHNGGATTPHAFWVPALFYWWVSTYLMVGLALFWGLMADLYGAAAGKRSFGPIAPTAAGCVRWRRRSAIAGAAASSCTTGQRSRSSTPTRVCGACPRIGR